MFELHCYAILYIIAWHTKPKNKGRNANNFRKQEKGNEKVENYVYRKEKKKIRERLQLTHQNIHEKEKGKRANKKKLRICPAFSFAK